MFGWLKNLFKREPKRPSMGLEGKRVYINEPPNSPRSQARCLSRLARLIEAHADSTDQLSKLEYEEEIAQRIKVLEAAGIEAPIDPEALRATAARLLEENN